MSLVMDANNNRQNIPNNMDPNDPEFTIKIIGTDRTNINIRVKASDTIQTVKQKYETTTGKSAASQRLIFRGNELKPDHNKLSSYKITGNAVLHVAFKIERDNPNHPNGLNDEQLALIAGRHPIRIPAQPLERLLQSTGITVNRSVFSVITCCAAYGMICCFVPLISLPDIITLIIVNDYDFNYTKDNLTRKCIWASGADINISMLLSIGSTCSILIYLLFAIWLFWYLRLQNTIQAHGIPPSEVHLTGCRGIAANSKIMCGIFWMLNLGMFCLGAAGIRLYEKVLSSSCQSAECMFHG
eukprot:292403_1